MISEHPHSYDLTIIGAGMAGMIAAIFAANRNISTLQIGRSGGLNLTSGLFDLMRSASDMQDTPWAAIERIGLQHPHHPYTRLSQDIIQGALAELMTTLEMMGLPYHFEHERNQRLMTALGTVKETYALPLSMHNGVTVLQSKLPCLIAGFRGLREFSPRQIAAVMGNHRPDLHPVLLTFPGTDGRSELHSETLARSLEVKENRRDLAKCIQANTKGISAVGLPAILGIHHSFSVFQDLQERIGLPLFEIPTPPVSVPGIRLREAFETQLQTAGIHRLPDQHVTAIAPLADGTFQLTVDYGDTLRSFHTRFLILATGRFMGKGLIADHAGIREPLFDLPVNQPTGRSEWHRSQFFHPSGHPINRAGLETNETFQPLILGAVPRSDSLFAAGSILAHQDWTREKCGTGLAAATAFVAVQSVHARLTRSLSNQAPSPDVSSRPPIHQTESTLTAVG